MFVDYVDLGWVSFHFKMTIMQSEAHFKDTDPYDILLLNRCHKLNSVEHRQRQSDDPQGEVTSTQAVTSTGCLDRQQPGYLGPAGRITGASNQSA